MRRLLTERRYSGQTAKGDPTRSPRGTTTSTWSSSWSAGWAIDQGRGDSGHRSVPQCDFGDLPNSRGRKSGDPGQTPARQDRTTVRSARINPDAPLSRPATRAPWSWPRLGRFRFSGQFAGCPKVYRTWLSCRQFLISTLPICLVRRSAL